MAEREDVASRGPADATAAWFLGGPLALALGALVLAQFAAWAPHYLFWPWWTDHDHFATLAMGWDAGLRPYRDVSTFQFPGTIYIYWALGKLFGWGRSAPIHALDAGLLLILGGLIALWSRRRLGGTLPGAVAIVSLTGYYLGLDYSVVAQRDWQAPLLAACGLLLVETRPGPSSRILLALLYGFVLCMRPQAVLLMPAMASAVLESHGHPAGARAAPLRAMMAWTAALAVSLGLAFLPILRQGLLGDMVRGVRMAAYGSTYSQTTPGSAMAGSVGQLLSTNVLAAPILIGLMLPSAPPEIRRLARTWLLALLGAALYKPISPVQHDYLDLPLILVGSILLAVLVHLLLTTPGASPTIRLASLLLVLWVIDRGGNLWPRFCDSRASLRAIGALARGESLRSTPPGYIRILENPLSPYYPWRDYDAALEYLRRDLPRSTRVANALKTFPAINGPSGHLPAFPGEAMVGLAIMPSPRDEALYASTLARYPDSVVVWSPAEKRRFPTFPLRRLTEVIETLYEPGARFGTIEVWRRKSRGPASAALPSSHGAGNFGTVPDR